MKPGTCRLGTQSSSRCSWTQRSDRPHKRRKCGPQWCSAPASQACPPRTHGARGRRPGPSGPGRNLPRKPCTPSHRPRPQTGPPRSSCTRGQRSSQEQPSRTTPCGSAARPGTPSSPTSTGTDRRCTRRTSCWRSLSGSGRAGTPGSTRRRLGSRRRSQTDQARTHRRRKLWPWPCASRQGTRRSYRHSPLPSTCLPDSRRSADRSRQRTQGCRCRSSRSKRHHSLCEACRQRTARSSCRCSHQAYSGISKTGMMCRSLHHLQKRIQGGMDRTMSGHRATGSRRHCSSCNEMI